MEQQKNTVIYFSNWNVKKKTFYAFTNKLYRYLTQLFKIYINMDNFY